MELKSYICGEWRQGSGDKVDLYCAYDNKPIGFFKHLEKNFSSIYSYSMDRSKELRKTTIHERARMIKSLAMYLLEKKEELYDLSYKTGATRRDSWIDIEGGIGTLFTISSKARKELSDHFYHIDGDQEILSQNGTFTASHFLTPLQGVAVHINAFNFPIWGFLEKLSAQYIAGMPAIIKPASSTSYLAYKLMQMIVDSNILLDNSIQFVCGSIGNLFDHLNYQDVVTFTGSKKTGTFLRSHSNILDKNIRFNMESDSLNSLTIASDVKPKSVEWNLALKEIKRETLSKAGQKCTGIRRIFISENNYEEFLNDLSKIFCEFKIGLPTEKITQMGALAGQDQKKDFYKKSEDLGQFGEKVFSKDLLSKELNNYAFVSPVLYKAYNEMAHNIEVFGPCSTFFTYKNDDEVPELLKKGQGQLVGSVVTSDYDFAKKLIKETAAHQGRMLFLNEESSKESTGHGSPLPTLVHGGPGRAGGGEELAGVRSIFHYMQRTSIQGGPNLLTKVSKKFHKGSQTKETVHPFTLFFEEIEVGQSLTTHRRTISESDIVQFAGISGDYFYAHMDEISARNSFFEGRVAHGYFVLSAAAGLFVYPKEGPVLANYGLDTLRFITPARIGDTIQARLTCKDKVWREKKPNIPLSGVIKWNVEVRNQLDELVADYDILTLVKRINN